MKHAPALFAASFAVVALGVGATSAVSETASPAVEPDVLDVPVAPSSERSGTNMILNGDFENNTYPAGCNFNSDNATVTAGMANITAFGGANEIDVMNDGTSCTYGSPPQSGDTKLAIHRTMASGGETDAFSFELTGGGIVSGTDYIVEWYSEAVLDFDPDFGAVEIGISNNASMFGTSVATAAATDGGWSFNSETFTAPSNATYLTVRVADGAEAWIHIDNFNLDLADPTPTVERSWAEVKSVFR